MIRLLLLLSLCAACLLPRESRAQPRLLKVQISHPKLTPAAPLVLFDAENTEVRSENPRLVGAILCIALGTFGMHRIYYGTDVKVPIFYTLTLGGGLGMLPAIDLLHILFVRDLTRFYNNPRIFMWSGSGDDE
jgi:TM2 domain-containing membrane protein YozV